MWSPIEQPAASEAKAADGSVSAPVSRCKHAAALAGDDDVSVLLLGGRGARGHQPLKDFWQYSLAVGSAGSIIHTDYWTAYTEHGYIALGRWRRLPLSGNAPGALAEHSALAHGQRLYVFGGEPALAHDTPLWIYDMQTELWRKLPGSPSLPRRKVGRGTTGQSPRGRRGHSVHALADCMLIYGGYMDLKGSTSELWAFHYESETWQLVRTLGTAPARHRHAAVLRGARLYVHGGQCDLRLCNDLWHFDTISHVWSLVRTPSKLSPAARSGHAGLLVGDYFYIYGGDTHQPSNELWRFHCGSETWERLEQSLQHPSPRGGACALLLGYGPAPPRPRSQGGLGRGRGGAARPHSLLARLGRPERRGDYRALITDDSNESLQHAPAPMMPKSHSMRLSGAGVRVPERPTLPSRISVPDFADMVLPTPVLSPLEATRLVYFDSEEEEELRESLSRSRACLPPPRPHIIDKEEETSDYCSAERVGGGFSNPHYLWDLTPDSGVSSGGGGQDLELTELRPREPPLQRYMLLLGGKEAHPARQAAPISMWICRLP